MAFLEVAIQADVSRFEDPDFEEVARRNCHEYRDTRQKVIQELRSMIIERGECHPRRMDDEYLLKFLRCRRFILALTHKLMVRYEDFQRRHASLYHCDLFDLVRVRNVYAGVLPESPRSGRTILMRFGRWDVDAVTADEVMRAALAMTEIATQQPKIQIMGASIVVDLEGLSLRQFRQFTPTIAHQTISLMGVNFPIQIHGVHLVNYNWLLTSLFYIAKQFIPSGALKMIHFHGSDMTSLHKHIDPATLPEEYGGHCRHVVTFEDWLPGIHKYMSSNEYLVRELRDMGYTIKDGKGDSKMWFDDFWEQDIKCV
ncbi:alpha-tocopherol transfer protein-like [Amyelois transitella]|uniref:alpha-tocopherol transfer protein-like n=1 Tax=Amyelois transitella TaxID=680683 RepID=UPI00298F7F74|nr:alpha-tocopherol transfer protein-like [Amyelois transitella]